MNSNITDIFLTKLAWRFFYYKGGRALLQFRAVLLYYKVGLELLQSGVGNYLKVGGSLLQNGAVHVSVFYAVPRNIMLVHAKLH